MNILGYVGIVLMNASMIPQIYRVIRLKNSEALSFINLTMTSAALIIFYGQALKAGNPIFCINYVIGAVLEIILLIAALKYRKWKK